MYYRHPDEEIFYITRAADAQKNPSEHVPNHAGYLLLLRATGHLHAAAVKRRVRLSNRSVFSESFCRVTAAHIRNNFSAGGCQTAPFPLDRCVA
jgi:hypothetical protein